MSEMSTAARELETYVDNDGDLYRQMTTMIIKNLATKRAKGAYRHDLAVKAFMYLADAGARKYSKEHGHPGTPWHKQFTVADRRQAAESWASGFETEAALGNYDNMVPAAVRARAARATGSGRSSKKTPGQLEREIRSSVKGEKARAPRLDRPRQRANFGRPPG